MKKILPLLMIITLMGVDVTSSLAQTTEISAQFRPRYEYRHGYKTLFPEGEIPASFVSQRTRLNLMTHTGQFKAMLSLQNVSVWGETGTLSPRDINGTSIHEAWAVVFLGKKVSLKAGRQEIVYDDHRIFGNVGWAQQGRSHDAAILKIRPREGCSLDLGLAYNANRESLFEEAYAVAGNYRSLQYLHYHRDFGAFGISLLFLNNGLPYYKMNDTTSSGKQVESIAYSRTFGTRITYKKEELTANTALYYQGGKLPTDEDMNGTLETTAEIAAYYLGFDLGYEFSESFKAGAGLEILSGNDMNSDEKKVKAFNPLYGTNHKFNGWMDYFYVGNHINDVGLVDIFLPLTYSGERFSASFIPHYFSSAGNITLPNSTGNEEDKDAYLGTELDFVLTYTLNPFVTIKAGYSQMMASESMESIKNTYTGETSNWAWLMLDIKPVFYNSK